MRAEHKTKKGVQQVTKAWKKVQCLNGDVKKKLNKKATTSFNYVAEWHYYSHKDTPGLWICRLTTGVFNFNSCVRGTRMS